jgi:hypothetical protein
MIDLKRFYRLYPQNLCWVEKANDVEYVIYFKRFNIENGQELPPEYQYTTLESIETQEQDLLNQLIAVKNIKETIQKINNT